MTNMDSLVTNALSGFLIVQRNLFVELLLDQHPNLFAYLNQLLLIYNDFYIVEI